MTTAPLALQLISLRCITAQENEGDEIYINVDGRTVWSVGELRMRERLENDQQVDEVDFVHGRLHTRQGWIPMQTFNAEDFRIEFSGERARLELRERDLLLGDDRIGDVEIFSADSAHGEIQLAFTAEGAHYVLRYRVMRGE